MHDEWLILVRVARDASGWRAEIRRPDQEFSRSYRDPLALGRAVLGGAAIAPGAPARTRATKAAEPRRTR